jgi:hypothetical protein
MTKKRTLAQATIATKALIDSGFPDSEGIQFDSDVCTPEDEQLAAVKNNILKKLRVRLGMSAQSMAEQTS